jgi:microcystin-dependent protein
MVSRIMKKIARIGGCAVVILSFFIQPAIAQEIPNGVIVMWSGSINNIPAGWALCDGNNGTPNLSEKFVMATVSDTEIKQTGGSDTHSHIYTGVPEHNHAVFASDPNDAGINFLHRGDVPETPPPCGGGVCEETWCYECIYELSEAYPVRESKNVNTDPSGVSNPSTQPANSLPPYYKLAYIMKIAEVCNISLVASFDFPGQGPVSGLAFDGKYLWAADTGVNEIVKMEIEKNKLKYIESFAAPTGGPHDLTGVTFDGTNLWCTGRDQDESMKIYKLAISGELISSFVTHGWDSTGLSSDGKYLYNVDTAGISGADPTIFKYEADGELVKEYRSPGNHPEDLAHDVGYFWHVDWETNKIYRLDGSMNTICSCDNPVSGLNHPLGVVIVEGYLWLSAEGTGKIYQLAID